MERCRYIIVLSGILLLATLPACDKKTDAPEAPIEETQPLATDSTADANDDQSKPQKHDGNVKIEAPAVDDAPVTPRGDTVQSSEGVPFISLDKVSEKRRPQIEFAQEQVRKSPRSADRVAELGLHYLAFGFIDEAVACFEIGAKWLPEAMRFDYLLALSHETKGDAGKAQQYYRTTIDKAPEYVPAHVKLGILLLDAEPAKAESHFRSAVERDDQDAVAWWGIGKVTEGQQRFSDAAEAYQRAIALQPEYADAHAGLARLYETQGRTELANEHRRAADAGGKPVVTNDPLLFEVTRRRRDENSIALEAVQIAQAGRVLEAAKYLERAIHQGIDAESIRLALGGLYLDTGRPDEAIGQFMAGLEKSGDSAELKVGLANAMVASGLFDAAREKIDEVLVSHPQSVSAYRALAALESAESNLEATEQALRKIIELEPNNIENQFGLIDFLVQLKRSDDAMALLGSIDPASVGAGRRFFYEGVLAAQEGNEEVAVGKWQAAIEANPRIPTAYQALAEISQKQGRTKEALSLLIVGIRWSPSAVDLRNNAAWILATSSSEELRNGKLAVELAERACELDGYRRHNLVGTLAAAQAEAGEFEEAERLANRAALLATAAGLEGAAKNHRQWADQYRRGEPLRY